MKPIHIKLSYSNDELPCGSSLFWGNPDLPEDINYPMYKGDDGEEYPYVFVCQINLAEIAEYDVDNKLPHNGLLAFFAKIDYYLGFCDDYDIGGWISDPEDVRVMWFPNTDNLKRVVLLDEDDEPMSPREMKMNFTSEAPSDFSDYHSLLAEPEHRPWETWDHPFEDWEILLQVDSADGEDFNLNFIDCGVMDFLISPADLEARCFDKVRAIVLST